ncbi:hypothetical protein AB4072_07065 [Microvirga sp. 2MCAF38]|uniref:hypothetical protein n=1 Tax=Microvirga sp. 2MCAF38 TaxID=3232989 RepID=UPI003F98466A
MIDLADATSVFEAGVGLGLAYSVLNEVSSFGFLSVSRRFKMAWQKVENDSSEEGENRKDQLLQVRLALSILESDWRKTRQILSLTSLCAALANVIVLLAIPLLESAKVTSWVYLSLASFAIYPVAAALLEFLFWKKDARNIMRDLRTVEVNSGLRY